MGFPAAAPASAADILRGGLAPRYNAAYILECELTARHTFNYRYTNPARQITTTLRLEPPAQHGPQRLIRAHIESAPLAHNAPRRTDDFGNRLQEFHHEQVWENLTFVAQAQVQTAAAYTTEGLRLPIRIAERSGERELFGEFTPLTTPDSALLTLADELLHSLPQTPDEDAAMWAFGAMRRIYGSMKYKSGSTTVRTTAAEAWSAKQGVCQDFAQILCAVCRHANLPARYVSGFLPGEGAMHAWVEVLTKSRDGRGWWLPLDPTHDRWINELYVCVAVGRDYKDITPTSGTFFGKGAGNLTHKSRVTIDSTKRIVLTQ